MKDNTSDVVKTPWTPDFVLRLRLWQESDAFHPYTCMNRSDSKHPKGAVLVPTVAGFFCPSCDYQQDWALDLDMPLPPALF